MNEHTLSETERLALKNEGMTNALAMMQEILDSKPEDRMAIWEERLVQARENHEYFKNQLIEEDIDDEREHRYEQVRHQKLELSLYSLLRSVCLDDSDEGGAA